MSFTPLSQLQTIYQGFKISLLFQVLPSPIEPIINAHLTPIVFTFTLHTPFLFTFQALTFTSQSPYFSTQSAFISLPL